MDRERWMDIEYNDSKRTADEIAEGWHFCGNWNEMLLGPGMHEFDDGCGCGFKNKTLRESVKVAMTNYFANLDGQSATDVYQMVLSEVEPPLLEAVMKYTRNNQSKAAAMLGLNRGTFRKKLKRYGMV